MPQIQLTVPAGALTDEGAATIQADLAATLLRWEGAPDNDFFRAQAWTYLHQLPLGAQIAAADTEPRFRVDVTVPAGALGDTRRAGLVKDVTAQVVAAAGLGQDQALRVWVLIHEQADGTWGAGGQIVRYADLVFSGQRLSFALRVAAPVSLVCTRAEPPRDVRRQVSLDCRPADSDHIDWVEVRLMSWAMTASLGPLGTHRVRTPRRGRAQA